MALLTEGDPPTFHLGAASHGRVGPLVRTPNWSRAL